MSIGSIGRGRPTQYDFVDNRRPKIMLDGEKIISRLVPKLGSDVSDLQAMGESLSALIQNTRKSDLPSFWRTFESRFNRGKEVSVDAQTDERQYLTGLSMFYELLNQVDTKASSTRSLITLRSFYEDARDFVISRHGASLETRDKRLLDNIVYTLDERFSDVVKHFNKRREAGDVEGPEIPN